MITREREDENLCRQCNLDKVDECECRCSECGENMWPSGKCAECAPKMTPDEAFNAAMEARAIRGRNEDRS